MVVIIFFALMPTPIALPSLPSGWTILGENDVLPRLSGGSRKIHDMLGALPFYKDGDVIYAMTVNTSSGALTRRSTAGWTTADYETYGAAWVTHGEEPVGPSATYSSFGHNVSTYRMAPVGGLVYSQWQYVITGITNDTTFETAYYDYYNTSISVTPLQWTVAIKMGAPTQIPEDVIYNSDNPQHDILAYWAGFVRKDADGTVLYRHPEETLNVRDMLYFINGYEILRSGLTDGHWYQIGASDDEVIALELGTTRPSTHPWAYYGFIRPMSPIGGYSGGSLDLIRSNAGKVWDSANLTVGSSSPTGSSSSLSKTQSRLLIAGIVLLAVSALIIPASYNFSKGSHKESGLYFAMFTGFVAIILVVLGVTNLIT